MKIVSWLLGLETETVAFVTKEFHTLSAKLERIKERSLLAADKLEADIVAHVASVNADIEKLVEKANVHLHEMITERERHLQEAEAAHAVAANITALVTPPAQQPVEYVDPAQENAATPAPVAASTEQAATTTTTASDAQPAASADQAKAA